MKETNLIKPQRVVTYLSPRYKNLLKELCEDREEKESLIVREIIKEYFDKKASLKKGYKL